MLPSSLEPAAILHRSASLQLAAWRELFFERWTGAGSAAEVRLLARLQLKYCATLDGSRSIHFVQLELTSLGIPDAEVRRLMDERADAIGPYVVGGVVVLMTSGFLSSILRGMISTTLLARRSSFPVRVVTSLDEAFSVVASLPRHRSGAVPASSLRAVYDELMQRLSEGAPAR